MRILSVILFIVICVNLVAQKWNLAGDKIKTKWADDLTPENVWAAYPRPRLVRAEWMNLNGLWDYALLLKSQPMPKKYKSKILIPFCIESSLSGVQKSMLPENRLWYKRVFQLPVDWNT